MSASRLHPLRSVAGLSLPAAVLIVVMLIPAGASAQTAFGLRWYGEVRPPATARALALGGVTAVSPWGKEPAAVGQRNPALMALAERVLYGISWEVGHLSGSYPDGAGSLWQSGPRMVGLVLPLGGGIAIGGSLQGLTAAEFEIHKEGAGPDGVPVHFSYRGTGGLSQAVVGIACRLPADIGAVGLEADILFGSLKQEWRIDFESADYRDTSDRLHRQHVGSRWTAGVQLAPLSRFRLGAAVSTRGSLDVKHIYVTRDAGPDTSDGEMRIGGTVLAGAGMQLNDQWAVYADYRRAAWDRTEWLQEPASITGMGAGAADFDNFSADWDLGIGIERQAHPPDEQISFWDTLPLRAGLRWGAIYAPDLGGGSITQWYATLGTAQPIGRVGRTWIDLTLQFGRRSSDTSPAREGFWRIQIGITGAERWFLPPQR